MDDSNFAVLSDRGLSILRLDSENWDEIKEKQYRGTRFSWVLPHAVARSGKRKSLALVSIIDKSNNSEELKVAYISSIQGVSTLDSRVVFDFVSTIAPGAFVQLLSRVEKKSLKAVVDRFSKSNAVFEGISEKLGQELIKLILSYSENDQAVQRIVWKMKIPTHNRNARALQIDAVNLALKSFGITDEATELALPGDDTALAGMRLQEDAVIEHDARWIDDWNLIDSNPTGKAVFEQAGQRLEVFTANKLPLEQLFGVDLIYLNQTQRSIVMVQYKMLERGERVTWEFTDGTTHSEDEWITRIDTQFKDELKRMTRFDKDLDKDGPYRLNPGAFFFKLVKRNSLTKSAPVILSLGHFNQLLNDGHFVGKKGGLRVNKSELNGHYIRNTGFIELIKSGYIGSRGATTDHLEQLIMLTLLKGKAVVAAIQSIVD